MGAAKRLAVTPLAAALVVLACGVVLLVATRYRPDPPRPDPSAAESKPHGPPDLNVAFAGVHPGMPRALVCEALRPLPPGQLEPVDLSGGTAVYRERHEGLLLAPLPPHLTQKQPEFFTPGPHVVTLEFDARLPGHPLTRVEVAAIPPR